MFFCMQDTDYELRISDWSSDVCSADLFRRKLRFNAVGFVQLDQPLATHGLDRVAAVGDDHHVGGEGGRAESGQGSRQCNSQAEGSPAWREPGKRCWHVACPEVDQGYSQTRTRGSLNKQCASRTARIPACFSPTKKRRPTPQQWLIDRKSP